MTITITISIRVNACLHYRLRSQWHAFRMKLQLEFWFHGAFNNY
jgi:hypothetical protein